MPILTASDTGVRPALVDSHAHLQSDAFTDDATDVLAAARAAGLERILVPAWNLRSTRSGLAFAQEHGVPTSAGIHPHDASSASAATWAEIRDLASHPEIAAIGETGLDYDRVFSPIDAQLANLRRHLELALETGKPLVLHCRSAAGERDAQDTLIAELRSAGVGLAPWRVRFGDRPTGVLHSFSGPVDYAETALAMGLAISFSGLVFRGGEDASADVARLVPEDRLLTETDSPFLKPRGVRGRRNEPRHVAVTLAWLAEQRGVDPSALGATVVAAFDRLVGVGLNADSPPA
jgi:TatD DNase family protein